MISYHPSSCMFSFIWTTHWATNSSIQDSISEHLHHHTLSNMFCNGISKAHCAWILLCSSRRASAWLIVKPYSLVWLTSLVFSTTLWIQLELPHPSIVSILRCVCTHPINPMGFHLLHCVHCNKCTWTHDVVRNTFVTIMWDVDFHKGWEQLHALSSNTFNYSRWQVDIVLTKDGIHTLIDVVIADPTQANLLPKSWATQGFVTYDVT